MSLERVSNKEKFIKKAKNIYGNYYDYSKVEYINAKTKILIICPKHGEFWKIPNSFLMGHKCKLCSFEKIIDVDLNTEYNGKNYRKEYLKLINNSKNNKVFIGEVHHILPKSMFPKWKNKKSNLIKLSYEDHYRAHYLLYKIYNNYEMAVAFFLMLKKTYKEYNPELYSELRAKMFGRRCKNT